VDRQVIRPVRAYPASPSVHRGLVFHDSKVPQRIAVSCSLRVAATLRRPFPVAGGAGTTPTKPRPRPDHALAPRRRDGYNRLQVTM